MYVINTEIHLRYFLFRFNSLVDFAQEYIYHSTCSLVIYVFLYKNKPVQEIGITK